MAKTAIGIGVGAGSLGAQFIIGGFAAIGHPLPTQTATLLTQAAIGMVGLASLGYAQYHNYQKNKTIASLVKSNTTMSNQAAVSALNIPTGGKI